MATTDWLTRYGAGDTITQAMIDEALRARDAAEMPNRNSASIGTPWGELVVHDNYTGDENPVLAGRNYWLKDATARKGYEMVTPLTPQADGTYQRGQSFWEKNENPWETALPVAAMIAPFAMGLMAPAAAAGSAGAGAVEAGIAGGSGLSLGGTGAMTIGETLGAAGGSGLSLGGSSLGTSLGAAGGSGLSLGGVTAGTVSSFGGSLGSSLAGLGDSTLSDVVLNGAWGEAAAAPAQGVQSIYTAEPPPASMPTEAAGPSGLSSADRAALYSDAGYGEGMTGLQNTAYNSVLDTTGSTKLASLAGDAAGLPGMGTVTKATTWLQNNPTLGKLLFAGGSSLLNKLGEGGGSGSAGDGGFGGMPGSYGPPQQWTSALQRGLYEAPKQVRGNTGGLAGALGINGASRWVR